MSFQFLDNVNSLIVSLLALHFFLSYFSFCCNVNLVLQRMRNNKNSDDNFHDNTPLIS